MDVKKVLLTVIRVGIAVLVVLAVFYAAKTLSGTSYDFGYRIFTEPAMEEEPGTDIMVQVKDGMSNKELGEMLAEKGLIRDSRLFYIQLYLSAYRKKILPGVYTLNTSMTSKEMMVIMATAEVEDTETEAAEEIETESSTETSAESVELEESIDEGEGED